MLKKISDKMFMKTNLEIGLMKNILIVEDMEEMRDLYYEFFQDNFHSANVIFAPDGVDAYMKCAMMKFDSIIMDHKMPRLKGLDLLLAIRNTPGINQETPIILISAFLPEIEKPSNEMLKDVTFISKPIDLDSLITNLADQLK
jgi:CheY-like chemotaxis protein